MAAGTAARIDAGELERLVKAVDPAAFLVPTRILRRVIRRDRKLAGIGLDVPHRKSYVIGREALRPLVEKQELGLSPEGNLPATAILLVRAEPEVLAAVPRETVLRRYWRLLFHAHVHLALERGQQEGRRSTTGLRRRVRQIGQTEFNEIRAVLRQEHLLLPPRNDFTTFVEFAAVYLELRHFAPTLLPRYFPALQSYEAIDDLLAADVDVPRLFAGTRLPGAPDPVPEEPSDQAPAGVDRFEHPPAQRPLRVSASLRLLEKADRAASAGNFVRAAIGRTRAAAAADPQLAAQAQAGAAAQLLGLADRLQRALPLDGITAPQWQQALTPLQEWAAHGVWPAEARLLYDLQKACVDRERELYAVDLAGWLRSGGSRPIKRRLEHQPDVLALKHLRSAAGRLPAARLADDDRARLTRLISAAMHQGEQRLRQKLRPVLSEAFEQVGLGPQDFTERIALHQLVEELLDVLCERGYLTMSQLRDAVSRNNLKLPDLSGPGEFLKGDALLRADRRLGVDLDGVYHAGEVYLRGLQRQSALAFGTGLGRFLTRYLALPFGGAFVLLAGLYFIVEEITELLHLVQEKVKPVSLTPLLSPVAIGGLGAFLFLLMHVAPFRSLVIQALTRVGQGLRLFLGLPASVLRLPLVRGLLHSRAWRFVYHYALKPLALALPVWLLLHLGGCPPATANALGLAVFLFVAVLANTTLGRDLEEAVGDWLIGSWRRLLVDIVPGLLRWILELFRRMLEAVDRFLYTVDEWLRFHGGDSRLSLTVKAVLGLIWFGVTYVVRFAINLLIEPQVNPIKHFPVVTVSHKLLLPFIPVLAHVLEVTMEHGLAWTLATVIIAAIPGIFGFLVWELKENWRLFRANRPETLRPSAIGHHGETMIRLLRPGFHSGTLPKLYTRLRRAERRAFGTGDRRTSHKVRNALHEVEESIRRFAERSLLAVLHQSRGWGGLPVETGTMALGSNRVRIELRCPTRGESSLWIAFEEQSGWLVAEIAERGWLDSLSQGQRLVLRTALAGFYKFAGVDLIREQIASCLGPGRVAYDIADEGLVVWTGPHEEIEAVYDLAGGPVLEPRLTGHGVAAPLPALPAAPLLYRNVPLAWQEWISVWEQDQAGKGVPASFLEGVRLLPAPL